VRPARGRANRVALMEARAHRQIFRHHPRFGRWYVPGLRARVQHERGGYYVVTNAAGARTTRDFAPKRPGVLRILVLGAEGSAHPHWHSIVVDRDTLLRLSTGVVVGMFRRAFASAGQSPVDFSELLEILRERFHLDVQRSLGVTTDEDALFLLYQLAQRDSYAPGDAASNLHSLVLKPTGPAARLPWFAG